MDIVQAYSKACTAVGTMPVTGDKGMTKVKNTYGVELDFEAAVNIMDEDICEEIHWQIAPCSDQEFFDAYCRAHEFKFDEEFELAKENPVW